MLEQRRPAHLDMFDATSAIVHSNQRGALFIIVLTESIDHALSIH